MVCGVTTLRTMEERPSRRPMFRQPCRAAGSKRKTSVSVARRNTTAAGTGQRCRRALRGRVFCSLAVFVMIPALLHQAHIVGMLARQPQAWRVDYAVLQGLSLRRTILSTRGPNALLKPLGLRLSRRQAVHSLESHLEMALERLNINCILDIG